MKNGKYAAIVTLQCNWKGGVPVTSTFRFVMTVENMGRNEVNTLVYEKVKEMTLERIAEKLQGISIPKSVDELGSNILFMSIDPE